MPHFVTDISPARRAFVAKRARTVLDGCGSTAYAFRLRLAALRDRAPDALLARVRRELREADAAVNRSV